MLALLVSFAITQSDAPPPGFHVVRAADVAAYALQPASRKTVACMVRKNGNDIAFEFHDRAVKTEPPVLPAYPAKIVLSGGATVYVGEGNATAVEDGWLATASMGEWGGGIFHFSKDWKTLTKVFDGNSDPIFRMADGLYCFGGLTHLDSSWGRLVKIERQDGKWMARKIADFKHDMPHVAKQDDRRFLVLDIDPMRPDDAFSPSLRSVDLNGKLTGLHSLRGNYGRPTTIQSGADGIVYVGFEKFVLKLSPQKGFGMRETWFEPNQYRDKPSEPTSVKPPTGFRRVSEADFIDGNPIFGGISESKPREDIFVRRRGKEIVFGASPIRMLTPDEVAKFKNAAKATVTVSNGGTATFNERNTVAVEDGWLGALDFGEWGGGVYWFSKDWKQRKDLFKGNSTDIWKMKDGLFVLTGSDYVRPDSGVLHRVIRGKDGWAVVKVASIGPSVDQVAKLNGQDLIIVQRGIKQLSVMVGSPQPLCPLPWEAWYPNSMEIADDGTIYLGYRGFILGIAKRGDEYERNWFAPLTVNSPPIYGLPANLRP